MEKVRGVLMMRSRIERERFPNDKSFEVKTAPSV